MPQYDCYTGSLGAEKKVSFILKIIHCIQFLDFDKLD